MQSVESRVDRLEIVLEEFVRSVGIEFNKLYNAQMRTEAELKIFKDEMQLFKEEIKVFKDGVEAFKDEMKDFKDEMKVFKDGVETFKSEMKDFKDEMKEINRDMNRKWGEMANKLGTITEDLVAPSLPRIIKEELNLDVTDLIVRRKKKLKDGRVKEFDSVAVAEEYIFVNYTKSTLKSIDINKFIEDLMVFREFFPEFSRYKLIGVMASLYVEEDFIRYAEKTGFFVLSVGDQLMEVKNSKGFKPKEW